MLRNPSPPSHRWSQATALALCHISRFTARGRGGIWYSTTPWSQCSDAFAGSPMVLPPTAKAPCFAMTSGSCAGTVDAQPVVKAAATQTSVGAIRRRFGIPLASPFVLSPCAYRLAVFARFSRTADGGDDGDRADHGRRGVHREVHRSVEPHADESAADIGTDDCADTADTDREADTGAAVLDRIEPRAGDENASERRVDREHARRSEQHERDRRLGHAET